MSENKILLLNKDHIEWFGKEIDESINFKEVIKNPLLGTLVEATDEFISKKFIGLINVYLSPFIADEYKDELHAALDDIQDGDNDYTVAIDNAFSIISQLKEKASIPNDLISSLLDVLIDIVKTVLNQLLEKRRV